MKLLNNGDTVAIVAFKIIDEGDGLRFDLECSFDPDEAHPDFRALVVDAFARFRNGVIAMADCKRGEGTAISLHDQINELDLAIVNGERGEG